MKNIYIVLGLVVVVAVVGIAVFASNPNIFTGSNNAPVTPVNTEPEPVTTYVPPENGIVSPVVSIESQADFIIEITTAGFSPAEITVKKGDSVIWTNRSANDHWIMESNENPYPEDGTCGTKLNSCVALKQGDSFKATLNTVGVWGFYDKLNPQYKGTITVQ